jgi:hypothetical protein
MAYSPSTGHKLRELQLESPAIARRDLALLFAESFARRLNEQRHLDQTDWEPRLDTIDPLYHARTL